MVVPARDPNTTNLSEVMTSPVFSISLSTDVRECGDLFTKKHLRHLVIVEEGALIGMISLRDVLSLELAEDEELLQNKS